MVFRDRLAYQIGLMKSSLTTTVPLLPIRQNLVLLGTTRFSPPRKTSLGEAARVLKEKVSVALASSSYLEKSGFDGGWERALHGVKEKESWIRSLRRKLILLILLANFIKTAKIAQAGILGETEGVRRQRNIFSGIL